MPPLPQAAKWVILTLVCLALIPPALIARTRAIPHENPRIHLIQDMDNQPKFRAQHSNPFFADGRAMRPAVAGTVARGGMLDDDHFERGVVGGKWATTFPEKAPLTMDLMRRGQERFGIFCQPCHGLAGFGDGMVNRRAMELVNLGTFGTTWVSPKSLHEQAIREQPIGQIFNSVTNGVRNMPAYASQIPTEDRWAIVAYVRALQRSQSASIEDVPAAERSSLQRGRGS
jgi:mono/diheme cytochrome c family protein